MTDASDDHDLEAFLRQFQPRAPSPLPRRRRLRARSWLALAAAMALTALWIAWSAAPRPAVEPVAPRSRPTAGELSVVLRPGEYEAVVDELEERVLADPRRRGGALRDLAEGGRGFGLGD